MKGALIYMIQPATIEVGGSYRLRREFEVRDEQTGTLKVFYLKGTVLKAKRVSVEEDHVWVEGSSLPLPLRTFQRVVDPA
jgi:hypothetical protein